MLWEFDTLRRNSLIYSIFKMIISRPGYFFLSAAITALSVLASAEIESEVPTEGFFPFVPYMYLTLTLTIL